MKPNWWRQAPNAPPCAATGRGAMRVLVACEFSGTVRDAFEQRGHFARSVDLLPTEKIDTPVRSRAELEEYALYLRLKAKFAQQHTEFPRLPDGAK